MPAIVSRTGVDLNPLDATDPDTERWLSALVWPEHGERRARLSAALAIARREPPHLLKGDLLELTDDLITRAPAGSRPVVFHSAVLAYLDADSRSRFADYMLERTDVTWIANEGSHVIPQVAQALGPVDPGQFVVSEDGVPRALADGHGIWYESLGKIYAVGLPTDRERMTTTIRWGSMAGGMSLSLLVSFAASAFVHTRRVPWPLDPAVCGVT